MASNIYKGIGTGIIILLLLVSCTSIPHYNPTGKNPSRAGKYPTFTRKDTLLGALLPERTCYDVRFYQLDIEIKPDEKEITGTSTIFFTATEDFWNMQVDLDQSLLIEKILFRNKEVSYMREFSAIHISLPEKIKSGSSDSIVIIYGGRPKRALMAPWEGGFVWKTDKNGKPWIGVACEADGASLWWPLKDHIADEPDSSALNITVPEGLMAISNGRLRGRTKTGSKETFNWFASSPVNNYNITLYVGDFRTISMDYKTISGKEESLEFYVLPYSVDVANEHFKQTSDIIRYFEQAFGAYPWWQDGFKLVESPFAGMEHQSAIAYGNGYNNHPTFGFDYIILHETAHEWWGNSLTAPDMAELWLHEGFATYSEAMYVEAKHGYDAYLNYLSGYRNMIRNERPILGPYNVFYTNYHDNDIYLKGAWFLHSLRKAVGYDPLFFDIIKTFAIENRARTVSTKEFMELVNRKTGKDLEWMFTQYLTQRKVPQLMLRFKKNGMYYWWEDTVEGFDLPVNIVLADGQTKRLNPGKEKQFVEGIMSGFDILYDYYFGVNWK